MKKRGKKFVLLKAIKNIYRGLHESLKENDPGFVNISVSEVGGSIKLGQHTEIPTLEKRLIIHTGVIGYR